MTADTQADDNEEVRQKTLWELAASGDIAGFEEQFAIFANKKAAPEDLPDTNARDWRGQSPLDIAAVWGRTEACAIIVEKGMANIDAQNHLGMTALHRAAIWGHADCVEKLLSLGASTTLHTRGITDTLVPETAQEMAERYKKADMANLIANAVEARRLAAEEEAKRLAEAEKSGNKKGKK